MRSNEEERKEDMKLPKKKGKRTCQNLKDWGQKLILLEGWV